MMSSTDQILCEYLQLLQPLSLNEIGSIQLKRNPAEFMVAEREVNGPVYSFNYSREPCSNTSALEWLVAKEKITLDDAEKKLSEFLSLLKKQLNTVGKFEWKGVGSFTKTDDKIVFACEELSQLKTASVSAQKIIREAAEHIVLVGETEKTSTEMTALLSTKEKTKPVAVLVAYSILVLSLAYLGWVYYQHSNTLAGFSNQSLVPSTENASSYHILP
jgi:hypothetical protein